MMERGLCPPSTYAQWAELFELLSQRADDEMVLSAIQRGTLEWQAGVAERFVKRLTDAVNTRINDAVDQFQKIVGRSYGQERSIIQAIMSLRREMSFLYRVMDISAIPEKDREQCRQLVVSQADVIQKSLEDSAKRDRSGKLLHLIQNNRVNTFQEVVT